MSDSNGNGTQTLTAEELDKVAAEAEAHRAQAALHAANARKALAEAQSAEAAATKAQFELAAATETEQARLKSDEHLRVYQFTGPVTGGSVTTCMTKLRLWDRLNPGCPIEVIFNSPGGEVINGMALFDLLHRLSQRGGGTHHLTIGVQGYAASMAGILLQAGDTRWIGRESYLMIHEISAGTGGKIGEIQDDVKFYKSICDRIVQIFVERSEGKCSRARFVRSWKRTDWWMLAEEARKLGFVDEIR